ncbi:16672_t:CDS:2 [Cetraspora pellucida]|uniref:16672_t:CDS:1 n=1 Tax=Cetraspora pellucida TaxID=1433469 RepID=A0A9N8Z3L3_9GLOM|nr:16672_t:CDS:2 [Cetraspora pellucida]
MITTERTISLSYKLSSELIEINLNLTVPSLEDKWLRFETAVAQQQVEQAQASAEISTDVVRVLTRPISTSSTKSTIGLKACIDSHHCSKQMLKSLDREAVIEFTAPSELTHWVDGNTRQKDKPNNTKEGDTGETERFLAILYLLNTTMRFELYNMIEYPTIQYTGLMKYIHQRTTSLFYRFLSEYDKKFKC